MPPRTRRRAPEDRRQEAVQYNRQSILLHLPHAVLARIAEHLHPAAVVRLSAVSRLMPELPCSTWRKRVLFSVDSYYGDSDSDSWETEPSDDDEPRRAYHDWRGPPDGTTWRRHPFDGLDDPLPADTVLRLARSNRLRIVVGLWACATQAELPAVIAALGTNKHHVERLRLSDSKASYMAEQIWGFDDSDGESHEPSGHETMLVDLAPLRSCSGLASMSQLRVLNLNECSHLRTLDGLQHCPQLECLQLHRCRALLGVAPLSGSIHVRLCALVLGGTPIDDLTPIAGCPLMHLNIDQCHAAIVETVHHFPSLTRLHGVSVNGQTHLEPFRALRNLERLDLRLSETLADVGGLADCTALRHLCLYACPNVSHVDALAGCERLLSLDLSHLPRLRSVDALGSLPLLANVKLLRAAKLDLSPLGRCPSLRQLDLSDAASLKGWAGLGRSTSLQMLALKGYRSGLSTAQVRVLIKCPSLRELNLCRCEWFDESALSAVLASSASQPQAMSVAQTYVRWDLEASYKARFIHDELDQMLTAVRWAPA